MKNFFGNWAGGVAQELVSNVTERIMPAHPILAIFCLLAASFFFFSFVGAVVLGLFFFISMYYAQNVAILILIGSLFLLLILSILLGRLFLKPKAIVQKKYSPPEKAVQQSLQPKKEASIENVVISFLDGFFSR
jgi:hypothetical protein